MLHVKNVRVDRGPNDIEELVHVRFWIEGHMTKDSYKALQAMIEVHYGNGTMAIKDKQISVADFMELLARNDRYDRRSNE